MIFNLFCIALTGQNFMGTGGLFEDPPTIANDTAQPETSDVAPPSPIKGKCPSEGAACCDRYNFG